MNEEIFQLGVKGIIRDFKGNILVLRTNPEKLTKLPDWHGEEYFDIPGGRVKKGDTVEQTLRQELHEELGIKPEQIVSAEPYATVVSNIRVPLNDNQTAGLILWAYLCKITQPFDFILSEEHLEAKWVTSTEAAKLLAFKYPPEFTSRIASL